MLSGTLFLYYSCGSSSSSEQRALLSATEQANLAEINEISLSVNRQN